MEYKVSLFEAPDNIDQKVVYLARVSSENQENPKYEGLISYLIREGHWSPLDLINLVFEINTQKDVGIQLLRHQTLKPQEYSQRYADCSSMVGDLRECRMQDEKNRQNSLKCMDRELIEWWVEAQQAVIKTSFGKYEQALQLGVAKEVARALLPIGLTNTKMYFNGSLRSWLFYCLSRTHMSTQKEHREVAKAVLVELLDKAPCSTKAFIKKFMVQSKDQYDFDFTLIEE